MLRFLASLYLGLSLLFSTQPVTAANELKSWAYVAYWMGDAWREAKLEDIDRLLFFALQIDQQGRIADAHGWPEQWLPLKSAAMAANRPLDLSLTLFAVDAFNQLFSNKRSIQQFRETVLSLAENEGVTGIHLDIEIYSGATTLALKNYQQFVKDLAKTLGQKIPSQQLSVFYPMGGSTLLYQPETLLRLGGVVFQGYDAHWLTGPRAGPVAPLYGDYSLTWEKIATLNRQLDLKGVETMISFPMYGYEWPVKQAAPQGETRGAGLITTFAAMPKELLPDVQNSLPDRLARYGAVHDPVSGSAYYKFSPQKGEWTEGWFEDWWTLGQKIHFICTQQISGIAFFPLGYDRNELLNFFLGRRACQN